MNRRIPEEGMESTWPTPEVLGQWRQSIKEHYASIIGAPVLGSAGEVKSGPVYGPDARGADGELLAGQSIPLDVIVEE